MPFVESGSPEWKEDEIVYVKSSSLDKLKVPLDT